MSNETEKKKSEMQTQPGLCKFKKKFHEVTSNRASVEKHKIGQGLKGFQWIQKQRILMTFGANEFTGGLGAELELQFSEE